MINLEKKSFDKERIKSRILKKAADLWGYKEGEMESFDPLVKLLIEAFAGEFEKISYEISETQLRIIERLTALISPDLDTVRPAYSIIQSRSVDPNTRVNRNAQFLLKKGADRNKAPGNKEDSDVFLSPTGEFNVYKGSIHCMVTQRNAFLFESGTKKIPFIENEAKDHEDYNVLWLGLDLEEDVKSLKGMTFFFDWYNEPQRELFYQYLPHAEWQFHDGQKISVRMGLNPVTADSYQASLNDLFDISKRIERQVSSVFKNSFVTLAEPFESREPRTRIKYPEVFARKFSAQELKLFKKELYWLRIKFPEYAPPEITANLLCAINCLPVINRKIHKINYKAQSTLNVIALESADSFLAVRDVRSDDNKVYKGIPLAGLNEVEVNTYTIRSDVNRLDQRRAQEILNYVLELLQDESASFAALGEDFLTSQIVELNQNIARLDQRLRKQSENKISNPYIILNAPSAGQTLFIEYWSTQGEKANNIPSGSKVSLFSGSYLDNNSTFLMTTTVGGRERPGGEQKINLLKKSLLSGDRIVTLQDIEIACREVLMNKASDIKVNKTFEIAKTPAQGFIRTILIEITPMDARSFAEEEWVNICEDLKTTLEQKSTANWPFKVVIIK